MIKKLTITNYKAFGPEKNEIELRPITILVGKNNSGKSSLLKLLSVISTMSDGMVDSPLLLSNDIVTLGGKYQDLFHNNDTSQLQIGLEYLDGFIWETNYLMNEGRLYFSYNDNPQNSSGKNFVSEGNPFLGSIQNIKSQISDNPYHFSTLYIGPIRPQIDRETRVGGENINHLVKNGENVDEVLLGSFNSNKKLFNNVSNWLSENLGCFGLSFDRNSESSGSFSLSVQHGNARVNIADVGQGIDQVLPIIVSSFMDKHADITLVEQPVLHLHPAAHQPVAVRLAQSAIEMSRTYVIETHSYNFLLAIRDMIADKSNILSKNDVIIYSVEQDEDESWIKAITIDEVGELSDWPEGVFAESYELLKSIKSHRMSSEK